MEGTGLVLSKLEIAHQPHIHSNHPIPSILWLRSHHSMPSIWLLEARPWCEHRSSFYPRKSLHSMWSGWGFEMKWLRKYLYLASQSSSQPMLARLVRLAFKSKRDTFKVEGIDPFAVLLKSRACCAHSRQPVWMRVLQSFVQVKSSVRSHWSWSLWKQRFQPRRAQPKVYLLGRIVHQYWSEQLIFQLPQNLPNLAKFDFVHSSSLPGHLINLICGPSKHKK